MASVVSLLVLFPPIFNFHPLFNFGGINFSGSNFRSLHFIVPPIFSLILRSSFPSSSFFHYSFCLPSSFPFLLFNFPSLLFFRGNIFCSPLILLRGSKIYFLYYTMKRLRQLRWQKILPRYYKTGVLLPVYFFVSYFLFNFEIVT